MAAVTICSDFGAPQNLYHIQLIYIYTTRRMDRKICKFL